MVKRGEFLERPALIEVDGLWLEGLYHRGGDRPGLLVCPPDAGEIGMDAPVVAELAFASARAGRASLRFQHRGYGASQGTPDRAATVDDARAALAHLISCTTSPRADVAAYRSGARTAIALARSASSDTVRSVVLVAPDDPPEALLGDDLGGLRLLVVLGGLTDEARIDAWRARIEAMAEGSLALIEEADHRFERGLTVVGAKVVAFLEASTDLRAGGDPGWFDDRPDPPEPPPGEEQIGEGEDAMIIIR